MCSPAALADLFGAAGLPHVEVRAIDIPTRFRDFDDYWTPFLGGQGPAPGYCDVADRGAPRRPARAHPRACCRPRRTARSRSWRAPGRCAHERRRADTSPRSSPFPRSTSKPSATPWTASRASGATSPCSRRRRRGMCRRSSCTTYRPASRSSSRLKRGTSLAGATWCPSRSPRCGTPASRDGRCGRLARTRHRIAPAAAALQAAWHREMTRIELTVRVDNERARRLYERFGFKVEGRCRRHMFVDGRYEDGYLMALLHGAE